LPITVGSDSIKENDEVVTMLFWKKEQKVVVALSPREVRLMMTALLNFRNKAVKAGKPTEDINELILRIMK
jgi:hypothetical protein